TNRGGQVVYKPQKVSESDEFFPLGGNRMPARVFVVLDRNLPAGPYSCKVTVTDRATKATRDLVRTFEVVPATFGLVMVMTSSDVDGGLRPSTVGTVGQNLSIHGALLGFGRGADKAPNAFVELRLLDEARRPTVAKPLPAAVVPKDLPPTEEVVT